MNVFTNLKPPRLLRTASFKLAAVYALLFGISVVILAAFVYLSATAALVQETRTRISADTSLLERQFRRGGIERLISAIQERQRGRLVGGLDYTVFDSRGNRLFGNLPKNLLKEGWQRMKGPPDGDEPKGHMETLTVLVTHLDDGHWLLVGDDVGQIREFGRAILRTFGWVFALVLTLAICGGAFLSFTFLKRIDSITRTVEAIIRGDIRRRIPLRGTADDIDRLSRTLNHMLDRITSLMDALRQVSSDIAHDLRTPLGRLRQTLSEAKRNASSIAEYEIAVDCAVAETDAILETFRALLRIAQIEAGTRRATFRPVDLGELVANIGQTYAPVAEDAGKHLAISATAGVLIQGDRELLAQMLVNLIENSIAHTQNGASISVSAGLRNNRAMLRVSDNGPGIPASELDRIFQRFYRLERSRTTPGSGLGLSLVAAIADLHHAEIGLADNNPGFAITIGFARDSDAPSTPADASAAGATTPTTRLAAAE